MCRGRKGERERGRGKERGEREREIEEGEMGRKVMGREERVE